MWQVWMEGFEATGDESGAQFMGMWEGETFKDACAKWAASLSGPNHYDAALNTYWACRLFDNERDARKTFG
jgi:hypothetical protein